MHARTNRVQLVVDVLCAYKVCGKLCRFGAVVEEIDSSRGADGLPVKLSLSIWKWRRQYSPCGLRLDRLMQSAAERYAKPPKYHTLARASKECFYPLERTGEAPCSD